MRTFFKYLFTLLLILSLSVYYLLFTSFGNEQINTYLSKYLSEKTQNEISIYDCDFTNYPHVEIAMKINKSSDFIVDGLLERGNINLHYHLWGDDIKFNHEILPDAIDVRGEIKGELTDIFINGKGMLLGGEGEYQFKKIKTQYREIKAELHDINSKNLFMILKRKTVLDGKADISIDMPLFNLEKRKGSIEYFLANGKVKIDETLFPLTLNSKIVIDNLKFNYTIDMNSTMGKINFTDGKFDPKIEEISSMYHFDIYDLTFFEKSLKHKYSGGLQAKGEMLYKDGFHITGETSKFDGEIYFDYDEKEIALKLEGLSLEKILDEFNYPLLLTSDISGTTTYNIEHKMIVFDNKLTTARLQKNRITDMILSVTKVDMTQPLYDKSSFVGFYQNSILVGDLKIDSGKEHLILDKLNVNTKTKKITSGVNIKLHTQEVFAKIYGTTDNPQFSIDMRRLINYQLERNKKKIKQEIDEIENVFDEVNIENIGNKVKSLFNDSF
ncbi:MAG: hypothetical protein KAG56_08125 [Sulfurovaceae bacterium]|nr:hypothetical protein [Sulfurovaceae bacterium]